jgi:tetratricopeptide (TPR) repeat protein
VPVFAPAATAAEDARFAGVYSDAAREVPRIPREAPSLTEHVEAERVTVQGCRPGEPILIRISYHPRWRSTTGERVWLAGPGFMLVFPEHETLDLVYSETAVTETGVALTVLALLGLAAALWRLPRQRDEADAGSRLGLVIRVAAVMAAAGFVIAGVRARQLDADAVYRAAQIRFDAGDLDGARAGYIRARMLAPLSNTAMHSSYFEGITLFKQERWAEARQVFDRMVATYPEALAAAEVTYHSGLCAEKLGEREMALAKFEETERRYPGTEWARYALAKLQTEK